MLRKTLYLLWVILLCHGCVEESVELQGGPLEVGKTVPLKLTLNIPCYDSPFTSRTRGVVENSDKTDGIDALLYSTPEMDVELTATPSEGAETRAVPEGVDNLVYGYHILQFDGITPTAKLKKKQYKACPDGVITTSELVLYKQSTNKQRIVVITNLSESYFNSLVTDSEYSALQRMALVNNDENPLFPLYRNGARDLVVMCGQTDMIIEEGATDVQASVYLVRTVVKTTIDIKVESTDLQSYINWSVSVKDMPNKSYVNQFGGRKVIFPSVAELGDIGYGTFLLGSWNKYTDIRPEITYLPVNLQPDVPGTMAYERRNNAPAGSTYLEVTGVKMSGMSIVESLAQFHINLGLNFTDNYSLPANYELTYIIRLKGLSTDDSGVIRLVPGKFGGKLVGRTGSNVVVTDITDETIEKWEYPEMIEIYFEDVATATKWASNKTSLSVIGANSIMDGFENTKKLIGLIPDNIVTPAYNCFKNINPTSVNVENYAKTNWYLPAIGQLLGTYIAAADMLPALNPTYWSSTGDNASTITQAYLMTTEGEVKKENINSTASNARAARNLP